MNIYEFSNFIKSIGFKPSGYYYRYKGFIIDLSKNDYSFYNGSKWYCNIDYNVLRPIENHFKQELRRIKLKELLE